MNHFACEVILKWLSSYSEAADFDEVDIDEEL